MFKLLNNRTFILVLSFVAGLLFTDLARLIEPLTIPALAMVLTVSSMQVSIKDFTPLKSVISPVIKALILNYFFLTALILILAWWLMPTLDLWIGYVLVAASPPGIAIVPFTFILKGNIKLSLVGTFGVYFISILLTPVIVYIFTGEALISPLRLLYIMIQLIIIPMVIAQLLRKFKIDAYLSRWKSSLINWGFFVVIFAVVGVNRDVFLKDYHILIPVSIVALISSFGIALFLELLGNKLKIQQSNLNSYILLATIKTSAFAAAVGLALYNEAASVPGAVISAWYALYFIYLGFKGQRIK